MKDQQIWGWPVIGYLFLGGLGGGMITISSMADLFWGKGESLAPGSLLAGVIIAIGSALLLLDLGRPFQFWRVLSRQKVIITFGAWLLGSLIITSFIYFSFWIGFSLWREWIWLRHILAGLNLVLGLSVCIYTGIFLGSMKSRPYWNTPLLPILFLISGLSTGMAVQALLVGAWPGSVNQESTAIHSLLKSLDIGLILLELLIIFIYVFMMHNFSGPEARSMAHNWLVGSKKIAFWGGLICLGLLLPGVLYVVGGIEISLISALILLGGLILRYLMVLSSQRRKLPGENF